MSLDTTQGPVAGASRVVNNGASGGTSQSPSLSIPTGVDWVSVQVNTTAVSGTSPNLTLTVQWSMDGGTTWADADATAADAFTAITAAGVAVKRFNVKAPLLRFKEVLTGSSTPTVTYTPSIYIR